MRVSVIVPDNAIVVDGNTRDVDLSEVDHVVAVAGQPVANNGSDPKARPIHAIQWRGSVSKGFIEFADGLTPEIPITSTSFIQTYVDLWTAAAPSGPPPLTPQDLLNIARREKAEEVQDLGLTRARVHIKSLVNIELLFLVSELWPVSNSAPITTALISVRNISLYVRSKQTEIKTWDLATVQAYNPATDPSFPS